MPEDRWSKEQIQKRFQEEFLSSTPPVGGICMHGPFFAADTLCESLFDKQNGSQHGYWHTDKHIFTRVGQRIFSENKWLFFDDTSSSRPPAPMQGGNFPIKLFGIILVYVWDSHLKYDLEGDDTHRPHVYTELFITSAHFAKQDRLPIAIVIDLYQAQSLPTQEEVEMLIKKSELPACPIEIFDCSQKDFVNQHIGKLVDFFVKENRSDGDYTISSL